MDSFVDKLLAGLVIVGVCLGFGLLPTAILALPFSWLWNAALVPAVHGFEEIGYWQAFGILLLVSIARGLSASSSS